MQVYFLGIMAQHQSHLFMLAFINIAVNLIGDEGLLYLSQANWPRLTQISLCNKNRIEQAI